jgi:hypothetical protein
MKRLLIRGTPTEVFEHLYVFNDGDSVTESLGVRFEDLEETVFALLEKYKIKHIDLSGSRVYTEGIERQIRKAGATTYSINDLSFRYV